MRGRGSPSWRPGGGSKSGSRGARGGGRNGGHCGEGGGERGDGLDLALGGGMPVRRGRRARPARPSQGARCRTRQAAQEARGQPPTSATGARGRGDARRHHPPLKSPLDFTPPHLPKAPEAGRRAGQNKGGRGGRTGLASRGRLDERLAGARGGGWGGRI